MVLLEYTALRGYSGKRGRHPAATGSSACGKEPRPILAARTTCEPWNSCSVRTSPPNKTLLPVKPCMSENCEEPHEQRPHSCHLFCRDATPGRTRCRRDRGRAVVRHVRGRAGRNAGTEGPLRGANRTHRAAGNRRDALPARTVARPKTPRTPVRYQRATFTLSFPFENMGANLPTLVATVCGNLYELSDHSGLKLLDLELPEPFADRLPRPAVRHRGHAPSGRRL